MRTPTVRRSRTRPPASSALLHLLGAGSADGGAQPPGLTTGSLASTQVSAAVGTGSGATADGSSGGTEMGSGGTHHGMQAGQLQTLENLIAAASGGAHQHNPGLTPAHSASHAGAGDPLRDGNPASAAVGTPTPAGVGSPTTPAVPQIQRSIDLPIHHPHWAEAVADAVIDSSGPGGVRMRLQLHPRDLGPVDISLDIHNHQAKLQISAMHEPARTAMQNALPQLASMLAGEGLNLAQADVGRQAPQQHGAPQQGGAETAVTDIGHTETASAPQYLLPRGLFDGYA